MKKLGTFALAALGLGFATIAMAPAKDIVDIAAGEKDFSTLVSLVKQAGLVETLKGDGPFTVFAPTNSAFAKLPKETLEAVKGNEELLKNVLLYHVVPGKVIAKDVVSLTEAGTALNDGDAKVKIAVKNGTVFLNDKVKVVKTDIVGTNGVIHVIDGVLVPPMQVASTKAPKAAKPCGSCTGK